MHPKRVRKLYSSGVNSRERCRLDTRDKEACSDLATRTKQLRTISSGSPLGDSFRFYVWMLGSNVLFRILFISHPRFIRVGASFFFTNIFLIFGFLFYIIPFPNMFSSFSSLLGLGILPGSEDPNQKQPENTGSDLGPRPC